MKKKPGFSLIELSVVILIIGILVIGITKGTRIINETKLKTANALTNSSPVASMTGIALWLDATKSSTIATGAFGSGVYTNSPNDGDFVTSWKDSNPQSIDLKAVSALSSAGRPKYVRNGIGGLPTIQFDGATNVLSMGSGPLTPGNSGFSAAVVFQKVVTQNGYLFNNEGTCNGDHFLITDNGGYIGCGVGGSADAGAGIPVLTKTPYYFIVRTNKNKPSAKVQFYVNKLTSSADPNTSYPLSSNNITVGDSYNGYISEIIIFDRAITDNEIRDIQSYLSKKYNIK